MADDWDLQAVVRGCSTSSTTTTTTTTATTSCSLDFHPPSSFGLQDVDQFMFFPDPMFEPESTTSVEELHHLFKPIFPKLQPLIPQNRPISPLSVLRGLQDLSPPPPLPLPLPLTPPPPPQQQQKQQQKQSFASSRPISSSSTSTSSTHNPSTPRSKRRKNQMKKVCEVPAEGLSSDMWSWRKYGQKPIKGSPYPRGYYRCSTSKGCLARKQVERNRSDPGMFIVTYTAEHNHPIPTHRNSLAGSTRQKSVTPQTVTVGETSKPSCSSPVSPANLSPVTEKMESGEEREDLMEDEDDDQFGASEMAISDDFFEGLDELTGLAAGDSFPDDLPASLPFPWQANKATTTATGGG